MFAILAAEGPADEVSADRTRDEMAATIDTEYQPQEDYLWQLSDVGRSLLLEKTGESRFDLTKYDTKTFLDASPLEDPKEAAPNEREKNPPGKSVNPNRLHAGSVVARQHAATRPGRAAANNKRYARSDRPFSFLGKAPRKTRMMLMAEADARAKEEKEFALRDSPKINKVPAAIRTATPKVLPRQKNMISQDSRARHEEQVQIRRKRCHLCRDIDLCCRDAERALSVHNYKEAIASFKRGLQLQQIDESLLQRARGSTETGIPRQLGPEAAASRRQKLQTGLKAATCRRFCSEKLELGLTALKLKQTQNAVQLLNAASSRLTTLESLPRDLQDPKLCKRLRHRQKMMDSMGLAENSRQEIDVKTKMQNAEMQRKANQVARKQLAENAKQRVEKSNAAQEWDENARAQEVQCGGKLFVTGHDSVDLNGIFLADDETDQKGFPRYYNTSGACLSHREPDFWCLTRSPSECAKNTQACVVSLDGRIPLDQHHRWYMSPTDYDGTTTNELPKPLRIKALHNPVELRFAQWSMTHPQFVNLTETMAGEECTLNIFALKDLLIYLTGTSKALDDDEIATAWAHCADTTLKAKSLDAGLDPVDRATAEQHTEHVVEAQKRAAMAALGATQHSASNLSSKASPAAAKRWMRKWARKLFLQRVKKCEMQQRSAGLPGVRVLADVLADDLRLPETRWPYLSSRSALKRTPLPDKDCEPLIEFRPGTAPGHWKAKAAIAELGRVQTQNTVGAGPYPANIMEELDSRSQDDSHADTKRSQTRDGEIGDVVPVVGTTSEQALKKEMMREEDSLAVQLAQAGCTIQKVLSTAMLFTHGPINFVDFTGDNGAVVTLERQCDGVCAVACSPRLESGCHFAEFTVSAVGQVGLGVMVDSPDLLKTLVQEPIAVSETNQAWCYYTLNGFLHHHDRAAPWPNCRPAGDAKVGMRLDVEAGILTVYLDGECIGPIASGLSIDGTPHFRWIVELASQHDMVCVRALVDQP